jgi:hypothetical protein
LLQVRSEYVESLGLEPDNEDGEDV